jgi:hypothetical protein
MFFKTAIIQKVNYYSQNMVKYLMRVNNLQKVGKSCFLRTKLIGLKMDELFSKKLSIKS